jgi:hypothetical protein
MSGTGAGLGADMLQEILQRKFREAATMRELANREAMLAEQGRQANMRNTNDVRRISLDESQFGHVKDRAGVDDARWAEQAPARIATVDHTRASTDSLNRAPEEAEKSRVFTGGENDKNRSFQGTQGALNRGNAMAIANIRHPDSGDAAVSAQATKEQNEVQDSLDLVKQIREDRARASSTGPIQGRGFGALADLEGFTRVKALHDNLVNKMQLAQAGKLKGQGQISNMEREMLKNAATALDMKLGDPDYLSELGKVEAQFQRMLTGPRAVNAPQGNAPAPQGGGFRVLGVEK